MWHEIAEKHTIHVPFTVQGDMGHGEACSTMLLLKERILLLYSQRASHANVDRGDFSQSALYNR